MIVLGISALYHDSAASLVCDGRILAAAQEERFTRIKHDLSVPKNAIQYCLEAAKITAEDIDYVVYYDNPLLTLDRFCKNILALGEDAGVLIEHSAESMFRWKLWIHQELRKILGRLGKDDRLLITEHHISHASSAFYPSPFEEAAFITFDGVGEWATTTIGYGRGNEVKILKEIDYPHSIGLLYSAFTYFCGFKVNSGDYKLMGLAPYGEPIYVDLMKRELIDIKEDGSYRLNLKYFDFYRNDVMTNDEFARLFGGERRKPESDITKREMDMASSVQKIVEEVLLKTAIYARKITGMKHLVLAGGVALNCVANGKLLKESIFEDLWIQPAAGDAGGSLGAALYTYYCKSGRTRRVDNGQDLMHGSYLGPGFSTEEVKNYLDENGNKYTEYKNDEQTYEAIATLLGEEKVIGLCNGRMEFGPRALGNRSIIGDARSTKMQSVMNLKIKYRESFRPFAPSVLEENCADYFDMEHNSPYMLLVAPVQEERQLPFCMKDYYTNDGEINLLPIVNEKRSDIPAVTHVDYSARIQTVNKDTNPRYYGIIEAFRKLTGCGVIVNTSFNVRGEPIVCTPKDAYECFMHTEMDVLVFDNIILLKEQQPEWKEENDWREKYALD